MDYMVPMSSICMPLNRWPFVELCTTCGIDYYCWLCITCGGRIAEGAIRRCVERPGGIIVYVACAPAEAKSHIVDYPIAKMV